MRNELIQVPCGKCFACLSNRRTEWTIRLEHELKRSVSAFFITLTYEDGKAPVSKCGLSELSKHDVQCFLKRLRKELSKDDKNYYSSVDRLKKPSKDDKLRYFITGEYGTQTHRPHYHGIFFNLPHDFETKFCEKWDKGFCKFGTVTSKSINYVTKYCLTKSEFPEGCQKPFSLMSTKPGIGSNYINLSTKYHKDTQHFYITSLGNVKKRLPRYYNQKIFTDEEREAHNEPNISQYNIDGVAFSYCPDRVEDFTDLAALQRDINEKVEANRQLVENLKNRLTKSHKL